MTSRHSPLPFDLPPKRGGVQAAEAVCLEREIVPLYTSKHDNICYNVAHFLTRSPASGDTMLLKNIRSQIISVKAGFAEAISKPVFLQAALYIRDGNRNRKLTTKQAVEYIGQRWKE